MHFAAPFFLNFLILLPVFAVGLIFLARYRTEMIARLLEKDLQTELAPSFSSRTYIFKNVLLILVFFFSVIALARPQWGFEWQEVKRQGIDIFLVVDTSKSMLAQDIKPSRLERTKMAVKDFLKKLKGDRVGLVTFAGDAFFTCPLTADREGFALALNGISSDMMPLGGTNIDRALQEAMRGYDEVPSKHKAIVIITDGENWSGDPLAWAKIAAEKKIRIFTIGVGTSEGELIQVDNAQGGKDFVKDKDGNVIKSRLNEKMLSQIAAVSGGTYVHASGTEFGLDYLYEHDLAGMEKREIESKVDRRAYDRFQWPLGLALLLLVVETLLTVRRSEPCMSVKNTAVGCFLVVLFLCAVPPVEASWSFWGDKGAGDVRRGNNFFKQHRYDEALKAYEKAEARDPSEALVQYDLGTVHYKKGDFAQAVDAFQKSVLIDDEKRRLDAYYNLGNAFYKKGIVEEDQNVSSAIDMLHQAVAEYDKALAGRPDDKEAEENKFFVMKELERLKKKEKDQQRQKNEHSSQLGQQDHGSSSKENEQPNNTLGEDQKKNNESQDRSSLDQKKEEGRKQEEGLKKDEKEDLSSGNKSQEPKKQPSADAQKEKTGDAADMEKMSQETAGLMLDEFSRNEEPKEMLNFIPRLGRESIPEKDW